MNTENQFANDLYCLSSAGFCVIPDFTPQKVVASLRRKADAWIKEVHVYEEMMGEPIGYGSSWPLENIRCLYAIDTSFQELAMASRMHAYAAAYLEEYEIGDVQVISNMPDELNVCEGAEGKVDFHRDHGWRDDRSPPYSLHCFVPLTEMTCKNGATVVVPGSHRTREPCHPFQEVEPGERVDGNEHTVYQRRLFPSSVSLEAPSGSLVLIDPMVIHSQGINVTKEKRVVLNIAFKQPFLRGLLNCHGIATRCARVDLSANLLDHLVCNESLPGTCGPLGQLLTGGKRGICVE